MQLAPVSCASTAGRPAVAAAGPALSRTSPSVLIAGNRMYLWRTVDVRRANPRGLDSSSGCRGPMRAREDKVSKKHSTRPDGIGRSADGDAGATWARGFARNGAALGAEVRACYRGSHTIAKVDSPAPYFRRPPKLAPCQRPRYDRRRIAVRQRCYSRSRRWLMLCVQCGACS